MAVDPSELSTDELIERFDRGDDLVDDDQEMIMMDSASGPMEVSSIRLPRVFIRAMEMIESETAGRSSIIRSALYQWLSENNPDVLIKAQREIASEIEAEQNEKKLSV